MDNCIFCKIIAGEIPSFTVYENDYVVVFMSLENHPMIVPKKHFKDVFELDDTYASEIMKTAVYIANATKSATQCEGVNLSQANGTVAGQDVFHFHLHIKPRWKNDGVELKWNTETIDEKDRELLCSKIKKSLIGD